MCWPPQNIHDNGTNMCKDTRIYADPHTLLLTMTVCEVEGWNQILKNWFKKKVYKLEI